MKKVQGNQAPFLKAATWLISVILVGLAAIWASSVAARTEPYEDNKGLTYNDPARTAAARDYEVGFMQRMSDLNLMALQLAEVGQRQAAHRELSDFCARVVESNEAEATTMTNWLNTWYQVQYQPRLSAPANDQLRELQASSGDTFDFRLLKALVTLNQQKADEAQKAADSSYHEDLINAARHIRDIQSERVKWLQERLRQWYGAGYRGERYYNPEGYGPQGPYNSIEY